MDEYRFTASKNWIIGRSIWAIILLAASVDLVIRGKVYLSAFLILVFVIVLKNIVSDLSGPLLAVSNNVLSVKDKAGFKDYDMRNISITNSDSLFGLEIDANNKKVILPTKQLSRKEYREFIRIISNVRSSS